MLNQIVAIIVGLDQARLAVVQHFGPINDSIGPTQVLFISVGVILLVDLVSWSESVESALSIIVEFGVSMLGDTHVIEVHMVIFQDSLEV